MRKNGFTLIEVFVAMTVGLIIMVAVYGYMSLVQKSSANIDLKIVTQQDTRTVLDLMAMEIRMASYLPPPTNMNTWLTIPACATMAGWGGGPQKIYKGIQVATTNTILVAMDLNGDGVIGPQIGTNEYIMYSYDGNSTLTRNVGCAGNSVILGGTATYTYSNVRNADPAVGVNLFRYFDSANNEITATVSNNPSTVNGIPAIRRILITIVADTADIDLNSKKPKRMVYSTSVVVRNHGFTF